MSGNKKLLEMMGSPQKKRPDRAVKLGQIVTGIMDRRVVPQYNKTNSVALAWDSLVPAGLKQHCKLSELDSGTLKVLVDSPAYAYELQLCSKQLIEQFQKRSPAARINKIKVTIG